MLVDAVLSSTLAIYFLPWYPHLPSGPSPRLPAVLRTMGGGLGGYVLTAGDSEQEPECRPLAFLTVRSTVPHQSPD